MKAQVRNYHGTPTLFLNDQPVFAGCQLLGSLDPNFHNLNQEIMRVYANAGVHIYSIDSVGPEWCGPHQGDPSHFDFKFVAPRLKEVIDADPDALFLLRMGFETRWLLGNWWNLMHPDELEILSDGSKISQSYASLVWQSEVKNFLKGYIDQLRIDGLYERVIAYQIATGTCGEWIKDWSSMTLPCGDYSEPMRRYFRTWLRKRYKNEPSALQTAWSDEQVTFDTSEAPSAEEQFCTKHFLFRDPRQEQKVIDYYTCYSELCAEVLIDFCRTVKEETHYEKLTGAFFGYLMELSWNDSFFNTNYGDLAHADVSTIQRSGHLGLHKVIQSPDIDFFVSPYGYAFRGLGGDCLPMQPSESLRVHGKIYLLEEDSLMHNNFDPGGRMQSTANSIAIYKRNFAQVVTHGLGITWLETSAFLEHPSIVEDTHRWLSRYQELGTWAMQLDRTPGSEVAVFLDDESFYYQTIQNNISLPLIWQQRVINLNRFGAPHDVYLMNDLLDGNLPPYKLYIFLNPFHLNNDRRDSLKQQICKNGKVSLWLYAPGYINTDALAPIHTDHMIDLTGFHFGRSDNYWGEFMHIINFTHPICQGLPQDLFWNTTNTIGPIFYLDDPEATYLGQVVTAQGRCKPGFGVKTMNGTTPSSSWSSVYVATPNIPAPVLRGIARYAGVHLYNDEGDVLYATPDLLSIHTVSGGPRKFNLPRKVEVVYDLYNRAIIAKSTDQFDTLLPPASTTLYFTGSLEKIRLLNPIL
jgi:hypothetical protein